MMTVYWRKVLLGTYFGDSLNGAIPYAEFAGYRSHVTATRPHQSDHYLRCYACPLVPTGGQRYINVLDRAAERTWH